jgi:presenilin-like A22 family membrane protease
MKHSLKITLILLSIFLITQFIGLGIVYNYLDFDQSQPGEVVFKESPLERPEIEEQTSYLPIMFVILVGTALMLILIKYKLNNIWKVWFLLAIIISLGVAFSSFDFLKLNFSPYLLPFILATVLGVWRIFKPNIYVQNFTELFIYGGLAALFVTVFNLWSISILLIIISIYDVYAVNKSKHMVKLAKAQTESKMFAGLMLPYKFPSLKKGPKTKVKTAILGGGDIAFPLLFAATVMKDYYPLWWLSLIIPFFALGGLSYLMSISKKDKFYPAMPFISLGCFLGLGVVYLLITFIL